MKVRNAPVLIVPIWEITYVRYGAILRVMFSSTCTSAFTARVHVLENMFRREVYFDEELVHTSRRSYVRGGKQRIVPYHRTCKIWVFYYFLFFCNYIVYFTLIIVVKKIAIPFKKFIFGNHIRCTSWKNVVKLLNDLFSLLSSCTFYWRFFFSTCTAKLNFRCMFFCTCTVIVHFIPLKKYSYRDM